MIQFAYFFSCPLVASAGGPIDNDILDNSRCINAPPLSVIRNQRLIEKEEPDMKSGESKTKYILKRDLVGVSSCYRDEILSTKFYDISVEQESLYAGTLYENFYENFGVHTISMTNVLIPMIMSSAA